MLAEVSRHPLTKTMVTVVPNGAWSRVVMAYGLHGAWGRVVMAHGHDGACMAHEDSEN
jgi:N-acetylglutamate synthase/N-acetylornithine aminotransferase